MTRVALLGLLASAAACSSEHTAPDAPAAHDAARLVDAPPHPIDALGIDAPPATVVVVDCATVTPAASVITMSFAYVPMSVSIAIGQVVKFTLEAEHDVAPDPAAAMTDSGLRLNFGDIGCLKFTAPGTFGYECLAHSFKGSVTVN